MPSPSVSGLFGSVGQMFSQSLAAVHGLALSLEQVPPAPHVGGVVHGMFRSAKSGMPSTSVSGRFALEKTPRVDVTPARLVTWKVHPTPSNTSVKPSASRSPPKIASPGRL